MSGARVYLDDPMTGLFWREFAERLLRQLSQVAVPILIGASIENGWQINWPVAAAIAGTTMGITAAKVVVAMLLEWQSAVWWKDLIDRVASAALTTFVGFFPVDLVSPDDADWGNAAWLSLMSGLIALAQYFVMRPVYTRGRHVAT